MDCTLEMYGTSAQKLIDHCKSKFGWSDLSEDVVMEIGCGDGGYCGRLIRKEFPDVRDIIFTDKDPEALFSFEMSFNMRGEGKIVDIEKRDHILPYEGKMTKVISTHVFQQLEEREEGFRNVYRLLKPGGEAALLFVINCSIYGWCTEMLKIPKWKELYTGLYDEELYKTRYEVVQYKAMVERIGFQVVDCVEDRQVIESDSDEMCKEILYEMGGDAFRVSPGLLDEFKNESFEVLLKVSGRDEQGRACLRSNELSLLLVKPSEDPGS